MTARGRADDGSDETIVSSSFVERAVLNGIVKMMKVEKVVFQVALKDGDATQSFSFSRTWTPPRTILRLAAGPLALVNATFYVADAELSAEYLLPGLPVLQHLGSDTKTLLEQKRVVLDGYDCSDVINDCTSSNNGQVSLLLTARLNRIDNDSDENANDINRPHVNYYRNREEEDPFPDTSLLDPVDSAQHEEFANTIHDMV